MELLESQGLERVILVGHAYAGMVVTGVAEVCPQRLAHLVYVNGVVPQDGEAMVDQLNSVRGPEFTARVRKPSKTGRISYRCPPQPRKSGGAGLLPTRRTSLGYCPGSAPSRWPPLPNQ